jgi:hypothetical protein
LGLERKALEVFLGEEGISAQIVLRKAIQSLVYLWINDERFCEPGVAQWRPKSVKSDTIWKGDKTVKILCR